MTVRRGPLMFGFLAGLVLVIATGTVVWLALSGGGAPLVGPAARGAQVYNANCATCHGGPTGGGMMDYPPKHNANGHTWHHSDCELKDVIRLGTTPMTEMMREMMAPPGAPTMPAWRDRLNDDEIDAVLAFIKTMWTEEQRAVQEQVTREDCAVAGRT
jgi:mono/diheme cytochrome c family protein